MTAPTRTFTRKQRPAVDCLASNPVWYRAAVYGMEGGRMVEILGERKRTEAEAVASAWAEIEAWERGERCTPTL